MVVITTEQRSDEWHEARLGIPTASEFSRIITSKGEPSKQQDDYIYRLVAERLTGPQETHQTKAMARGVELEQEARVYYEFLTGSKVEEVGFILHDSGLAGCSPDGLIGDDGGLELKCPLAHTHIKYLERGVLPVEYYQQVQGSLWVTGREWWDFMSYYPGLKPLLIRVYPEVEFLDKLEKELKKIAQKAENILSKIEHRRHEND